MEFFCGPLRVILRAEDAALLDKAAESLRLYNFTWPAPYRRLDLALTWSRASLEKAAGSFLTCARMSVDSHADGLFASTVSGACASGRLGDAGDEWSIGVSRGETTPGTLSDVEDLIGLALTTGWRRHGWVPIHAAGVVKDGRCVVLCATSGGGKTTLTLGLVRRGWQAIGDDKLLLSCGTGSPTLAALVHTCNLHPQTRAWFPEVGDLRRLPVYSAWTEKRRVPIEAVWPGGTAAGGRPTHIAQLDRSDAYQGIRVMPLAPAEILPTLLRQTVLPNDRGVARQMLQTIADSARHLCGVRVEIGKDAYRDGACLEALEAALA